MVVIRAGRVLGTKGMELSVPNALATLEEVGPDLINDGGEVDGILAGPVEVPDAAVAAAPQDQDAGLGDGLLGGEAAEATEPTEATEVAETTAAVEPRGMVPADSSRDFFVELEAFFKQNGGEFRTPKFYGVEVDLYK